MRVVAETDGTKIYLTTALTDKARALEVPGGKWDKGKQAWRYPLSWATCIALRGVFGNDLDLGPSLHDWATTETERRVRPAMEARECSTT